MKLRTCPNWRGFLATDEKIPDATAIARGRCKQWKCPYCSEVLRLAWRSHLSKEIQRLDEKQWCFFTLTFGSMPVSYSREKIRDTTYQASKRAWDVIMKRLKREHGKFQYVRVLELQKRGAVHIHCIASFHFHDIETAKDQNGNEYTFSKGLKKDAKDVGFGFMTSAENLEIIEADTKRVAGYITKYITKSERSDEFWLPKNARFLVMSRDFISLEKSKPHGEKIGWWRMGNAIGEHLSRNKIYSLNRKRYIKHSELDENGEYFED